MGQCLHPGNVDRRRVFRGDHVTINESEPGLFERQRQRGPASGVPVVESKDEPAALLTKHAVALGKNVAENLGIATLFTAPAWIDGRSLRATGRTAQFATRIKPEYHKKAKLIAARDGITLAELFEKGVDAYEREHPSP